MNTNAAIQTNESSDSYKQNVWRTWHSFWCVRHEKEIQKKYKTKSQIEISAFYLEHCFIFFPVLSIFCSLCSFLFSVALPIVYHIGLFGLSVLMFLALLHSSIRQIRCFYAMNLIFLAWFVLDFTYNLTKKKNTIYKLKDHANILQNVALISGTQHSWMAWLRLQVTLNFILWIEMWPPR